MMWNVAGGKGKYVSGYECAVGALFFCMMMNRGLLGSGRHKHKYVFWMQIKLGYPALPSLPHSKGLLIWESARMRLTVRESKQLWHLIKRKEKKKLFTDNNHGWAKAKRRIIWGHNELRWEWVSLRFRPVWVQVSQEKASKQSMLMNWFEFWQL